MKDEPHVDKRLGRRIRVLREQAGVTRQDLADKLDVTYQTVWNIEHGFHRVKIANLGSWARALGVTTDKLIDGLGYTGEWISLTGAGKAGTAGSGERR
jgi:transcriptional regulator with XRE-family HTH domain